MAVPRYAAINDPRRRPSRPKSSDQMPQVHVERGMVLEDPGTGFVGAAVRVEKSGGMQLVELEDRRGVRRAFPLGPGLWLNGTAVNLLPPRPHQQRDNRTGERVTAVKHSNSGSRAVAGHRASVAKVSRLWVEGTHDAQLVQHVWGHDLAVAGIAVELLDGADNLQQVLQQYQPHAKARAGILLDHLVVGSKETLLATRIQEQWGSEAVMIAGHPYVDVWQAVKPARVGLEQWPEVPRDEDIKVGTLRRLGWAHGTKEDIGLGWQKILGQVRNYRDLEAPLLGAVESLIDFVTEPHLTEPHLT